MYLKKKKEFIAYIYIINFIASFDKATQIFKTPAFSLW
jgi:hypothetical protein